MYNYKATEYRQILLYTGMVLFKPFLSTILYHHFLLLVYAYRMLSGKEFLSGLPLADNLLEKFVPKFRNIYKKVGINVHNLLHLSDCARRFGSINSFSSYNFENHIQKIGRLVRGKKLVLKQIWNRVAEWQRLSVKFELGHVAISQRFYKNNGRDCYVELSEERLGKIVGMKGSQFEVKVYVSKSDLFSYPVESSRVGVHVVSKLGDDTFYCKRDDFLNKYYGVPFKRNQILIKIL